MKIYPFFLTKRSASGDFNNFLQGDTTPSKRSNRLASFTLDSIHITEKVINKNEYKKIIAEVAEILYDHFCQQQKLSFNLSNDLGNPPNPYQQEVAIE